jgi:hypothetical protein
VALLQPSIMRSLITVSHYRHLQLQLRLCMANTMPRPTHGADQDGVAAERYHDVLSLHAIVWLFVLHVMCSVVAARHAVACIA